MVYIHSCCISAVLLFLTLQNSSGFPPPLPPSTLLLSAQSNCSKLNCRETMEVSPSHTTWLQKAQFQTEHRTLGRLLQNRWGWPEHRAPENQHPQGSLFELKLIPLSNFEGQERVEQLGVCASWDAGGMNVNHFNNCGTTVGTWSQGKHAFTIPGSCHKGQDSSPFPVGTTPATPNPFCPYDLIPIH